MKRKVTQIPLAAFAGASCLLSGYSAKAALVAPSAIPPSSNRIIALVTTGAPTGVPPDGYGSFQVGSLNVSMGGPVVTSFPGTGLTTGFVSVTGESPTDTMELYALELYLNGTPISPANTTTLDQIIADITGSNRNASASQLSSSPYAELFPPGYNILITTSAGSASPYFAFDFRNALPDVTDTDTALGAVTVTGIAAVPEPAGATGVVLGVIAILSGRRHRTKPKAPAQFA